MRTPIALLSVVVATAVGCSAYPAYLLTAVPDAPVDRMSAVEATVVVLQDSGYTVTVANENLGIVTTDWADKTNIGTKLLYGVSGGKRKRVSVNVGRGGDKLTVQITSQSRSVLQGWQNNAPGEREREEAKELLRQIHALLPTSVTFALAENVNTLARKRRPRRTRFGGEPAEANPSEGLGTVP